MFFTFMPSEIFFITVIEKDEALIIIHGIWGQPMDSGRMGGGVDGRRIHGRYGVRGKMMDP